MANLGCLRVIARLLLVVVGLVIIFFLGRSALEGIRDLADRAAMRRAQDEQAAAYPDIATGIAQQNATLFSSASPAVTDEATENAAPTDDATQPAFSTEAASATVVSSTETAIPSETTAPSSTSAPTNTTQPSETPTTEVALPQAVTEAASSTSVPSETPSATVTSTETLIPPTATETSTNVPPTSTETSLPPSATLTETATATETSTSTTTFTPTVTASNTAARILIPTNTRRPALATNTAIPPTITPVPPTATPAVVGELVTNTPTSEPPTVAVTPIPTQPEQAQATAPEATPTVGELIAALPTVQATSTLPRVLGRDSCTDKPQPTAVPTSAPRLKSNGNDIMNILLLGSDQDVDPGDPSYRTDVILIVSINRTTNTVSMLSLPRDLYVCIPALGMNRINVAYEWGEAVGWAPGGGFGLMQETILYNTGIPIHYYARISLTGFKQIVDSVGGVDIAVECPIRDSLRWLGKNDESGNPLYEDFSLEPGYYHMDGSFALWYARTRKATTGGTDFDRNRRQQQVLRAIWHTARDQGLIQKAPDLWNQLTSIVDTNLNLVDALGLAPIALNLEPGQITTYYMFKGYELDHFKTPANEDVQIPVPENFFRTIENFYTPPSANRLGQENAKTEIYNGTGNPEWDKMAAEVLAYKGLVGAVSMGAVDATPNTVIYDFTGGASPASLNVILKAYGLNAAVVVNQPDPNRTIDFKITLGGDFNACTAPGYQR